jgi:AcrR family transcriptional regulator
MALPRTTRSEQTVQAKQRILDAAAQMFAERGYAATAMQDIAAELGLTRAALYYHYPAKGDILQAIIDGETARFAATLDDIAAIPSRAARIEATIAAIVASGLNQRRRIVFLVSDPALRTLPEPDDGPDFFDRVAAVVYGPEPTTEQRWAVNAAFMSFAALPSFAHLTDDQLVPLLTGSLRRLLRVR